MDSMLLQNKVIVDIIIQQFFASTVNNRYLFGITGGVSVGKTTIATLLLSSLIDIYPMHNFVLITTDSFIYSNSYLKQHNILHNKGYPESFNLIALRDVIYALKHQQCFTYDVPIYSHDIKDITVQYQHISINEQPTIIVFEGINLIFQPQAHSPALSQLLDACLYVELDHLNTKQRAIQRFMQAFLAAQASSNNIEYFREMLHLNVDEVYNIAEKLWMNNDFQLMQTYIEPYKALCHIIDINDAIRPKFIRKQ